MKKYIIGTIGILVFLVTYYYSGSLLISCIASGAIIMYACWIIWVEFSWLHDKTGRSQKDEYHKLAKKEHMSRTDDNPTLR